MKNFIASTKLTSTGRELAVVALLSLTAAAGADEPLGVRLDLLQDGVPFTCQVPGDIKVSGSGRIQATCSSGEAVDCSAAPWDWVYDQPGRTLMASCLRNTDPGFMIEVNPATQSGTVGGSVTWQVRVRNTGSGPLSSVQVTTTPATSGCNRTFSTLNAGGTISYSCAFMNIPGSTTIHFNGTATRGGSPATTSAAATITVGTQPPPNGNVVNIKVCRGPAVHVIAPGQGATWEVRVENTGDWAWGSVQLTDSVPSNCGRTISNLQPGAQVVYSCSRAAAGEYSATLSFVAVESLQSFTMGDQVQVRVAYDQIFRGRFGTLPAGH